MHEKNIDCKNIYFIHVDVISQRRQYICRKRKGSKGAVKVVELHRTRDGVQGKLLISVLSSLLPIIAKLYLQWSINVFNHLQIITSRIYLIVIIWCHLLARNTDKLYWSRFKMFFIYFKYSYIYISIFIEIAIIFTIIFIFTFFLLLIFNVLSVEEIMIY